MSELGKITFTPRVNDYIVKMADNLAAGDLDIWQLPDCLAVFYWLAWHDGRESRQPAIDHLRAEADRFYAEMCRRAAVPFTDPNRPSYADLERIRGNQENADRIDATNRELFAEATK